MKKQIIPALCVMLALCLALASCGGTIGEKTTAAETTEEITATEAPISILDPRDPADTYAMDPPFELYTTDSVNIWTDQFHYLALQGSEAAEVVAMLEIVNSLTSEQLITVTDTAQHLDQLFLIEFKQGNTLYLIFPCVLENGYAHFSVLEHDLIEDKQKELCNFYFEHAEWASLVDRMEAMVPVLSPRDPEKTYAVEPALKLLADDKVDIYPQYLNLVSFRGEEATELIKMLDIVNTLSPEQVSTPTAPLQVADELFVIEVQQGDILYMIKPKVLENGDAYVCIAEHDLSKETKQQRILYEFQFDNDRWASLIDKMQALAK